MMGLLFRGFFFSETIILKTSLTKRFIELANLQVIFNLFI